MNSIECMNSNMCFIQKHEAQSVFFSEWTTAEGAYVYSPEVYINLWKDLPMQAGANKLYTPLGLQEYEKYTPMFCTTGSPRVGRAIQDTKSKCSDYLFCQIAVHC